MNNYAKAAIALFIVLLLSKKVYSMSSTTDKTNVISFALLEILNKYGRDKAKRIEQILRLETAHFKSGQWTRGNTAGMEVGNDKTVFPFGWSSLAEFVKQDGKLNPSDFSTYTMVENRTGKIKRFIKFPTTYAFIMFLGFLFKKRNWDFASWYSTKPESKARYLKSLDSISPKIVNSFDAA